MLCWVNMARGGHSWPSWVFAQPKARQIWRGVRCTPRVICQGKIGRSQQGQSICCTYFCLSLKCSPQKFSWMNERSDIVKEDLIFEKYSDGETSVCLWPCTMLKNCTGGLEDHDFNSAGWITSPCQRICSVDVPGPSPSGRWLSIPPRSTFYQSSWQSLAYDMLFGPQCASQNEEKNFWNVDVWNSTSFTVCVQCR